MVSDEVAILMRIYSPFGRCSPSMMTAPCVPADSIIISTSTTSTKKGSRAQLLSRLSSRRLAFLRCPRPCCCLRFLRALLSALLPVCLDLLGIAYSSRFNGKGQVDVGKARLELLYVLGAPVLCEVENEVGRVAVQNSVYVNVCELAFLYLRSALGDCASVSRTVVLNVNTAYKILRVHVS